MLPLLETTFQAPSARSSSSKQMFFRRGENASLSRAGKALSGFCN